MFVIRFGYLFLVLKGCIVLFSNCIVFYSLLVWESDDFEMVLLNVIFVFFSVLVIFVLKVVKKKSKG